ncbi:MAG: anti-sigma factor antagonist, partial [Verrucomicrobiaceae bacterium]
MATVSTPEPGVLVLEGEIDLHESPAVRERLNPLIDAKLPQIIVDLGGVSYIDSSGLA